jgi:hypothetical protein
MLDHSHSLLFLSLPLRLGSPHLTSPPSPPLVLGLLNRLLPPKPSARPQLPIGQDTHLAITDNEITVFVKEFYLYLPF